MTGGIETVSGRKLVFAINISLDGFADHTITIADDELHDFFSGLLDTTDIELFGRVTYQLMAEYWPRAHQDPDATKSIRDFADKFNAIPKIVFSRTLEQAGWNNSTIIRDDAINAVIELKKQPGKNLSLGGIRTIQEFLRHGLVDECWLVIHPVIVGKGRRLFEGVDERLMLTLLDTRSFKSGAVAIHYALGNKNLGIT